MLDYKLAKNDDIVLNNRAYWNKMYDGYTVTGETLREEYPDGSAVTYVVYQGKKTLTGMCRKVFDKNYDRFIIARYDRYDEVIKGDGFFRYTIDVEDK